MKQEHIPDLLLLFSHSITALLVSIFHHVIDPYPKWIKLSLLFLYLILIFAVYRFSKKLLKARAESDVQRELAEQQRELANQQRYNHLRARMLEVVAEFIKERYQINYELISKLNQLDTTGEVSAQTVKAVLDDADRSRVEKIKEALKSLSSALREDVFKKPPKAEDINRDEMKVSFYAVENDPDVPARKALIPKARYYPNEGAPRTSKFSENDGVAGEAWGKRIVIVCENGGEDPRFMEKRPGQKEEYASMICVPSIMDVPGYKISEVYGILTLDSPIRRGYFQEGSEKFWADLLQPICNILIYARESSRLIATLNHIIDNLSTVLPASPPLDGASDKAPNT
jgi:hypothetical protein